MRMIATLLALGLVGACQEAPSSTAQSPAATPADEQAEQEARAVTVTIIATVPEDAGDIFITGNREELGPWNARGQLMDGEGRTRTTTLTMPEGFEFQFKLTGGTWNEEGVGPSGMVLPNFTHTATANGNNEVEVEIFSFKRPVEEYIADPEGSGVLGTLVYWTDTESAFFDITRNVEVWLPPGYGEDPERRYPVIYMHDGQNLFDPRIANTGTDWGVDEAMMANVEAGLHDPAIVVGIWSTSLRGYELSPWHGATNYARMILEEIKPRVDAEFLTLTDRDNTYTMGSSMGGLVSMYLVRTHPDVFSACGCVATHVPLSPIIAQEYLGLETGDYTDLETPYLVQEAAANASLPTDVRMYFDWGTEGLDALYPPVMAELEPWLEGQNLVAGETYAYREFVGETHNEAAWRARVHLQLAWLLGGIDPNTLDTDLSAP